MADYASGSIRPTRYALTSATVSATPTPRAKTFFCSTIGNLLSKSDVGAHSYPTAVIPKQGLRKLQVAN
jgi:hypothetical protein